MAQPQYSQERAPDRAPTDSKLSALLESLRVASATTQKAKNAETEARRAVVIEARRQGMSLREIARLMDLSHQRVATIERDLLAKERRDGS